MVEEYTPILYGSPEGADGLPYERWAAEAVEDSRRRNGVINENDTSKQQELAVAADQTRVDWFYNRGPSKADVLRELDAATQAGVAGIAPVRTHFESNLRDLDFGENS